MNFNEITKLIKEDNAIDYKGVYSEDILAYISLRLVYLGYSNGFITKEEASRLKERIHTNHHKLMTRHYLYKAEASQHQDFINKAREYRSELNKGFGNKSDKELLDIAIKCISTMCCDSVILKMYEERK